ncbi:hypothetical protein JCM10908_005518 [Rhodotorula pacifica]|uniref:uncharacterized protein n=1 Tax=Rhodotorula pacifica TaxID=1495444 RepID=UPI003171C1FD
MASASPPPPPDPNRFRTSPSCGSSSSSPPRNALRRSKTVANPESPLRWRREPLVDVTNLVLGRAGREWTGRLQRLPSVEPSPFEDAADAPETPTRAANRRLPLRRTRSAMPHIANEASSSPSRPAESLGALPTDGLDSPLAPSPAMTTTRELRPRTRPAVTNQESSRRAARNHIGGGSGAGGGTGGSASLAPPAPLRSGTPLARRRTFGGLDSLSTVQEDAAELSLSRPMTPLTRSRSEAGIDGGVGNSSSSPPSNGDGTRRLRRRRTTEPTSPSASTSATSTSGSSSRGPTRKGLR